MAYMKELLIQNCLFCVILAVVSLASTEGSKTSCRSNICDQSSPGLRCNNGGAVHVTEVTCSDGISPCTWSTFVTLYTLCEGQSSCASSGLRTLMPTYCARNTRSLRNVFVDYVCLPESLIAKTCTGTPKELIHNFGVIMNPGYTNGAGSLSGQCYWLIKLRKGQRAKVIINLSYSKEGMPNCTSQFLQVRFTQCRSKKSRIESYCDLRKVNQEILSCGNIYITSFLPSSMQDLSDRFLISYYVFNTGSPDDVSPGSNVTRCGPVVRIPNTSLITSTHEPSVLGRNYGPKDSIFEDSDDISGDAPGEATVNNTATVEEITLKFKLIVLYIFFGIVILALILALIFVIISYRGIAQKGRYDVGSSEKVALWKSEDTKMETFRHNSIAETSHSGRSETAEATVDKDDSKVVATVHIEAPSDDEKRMSTGSGGFSSFLSDKREDDFLNGYNPYASYSSLSNEQTPKRASRDSWELNGVVRNGYDSGTHGEAQPLFGRTSTPALPGEIQHYTINDDDYAIVRKPRKSDNKTYNPLADSEPTYDNLFHDDDVVGFKPTSGPYDKDKKSGTDRNFRFSAQNGWDDEL